MERIGENLENLIKEILSVNYRKEKVRDNKNWVTIIRLSNGVNIYPNKESLNIGKILSNDIILFLKLLLGIEEIELVQYDTIINDFVKKLVIHE